MSKRTTFTTISPLPPGVGRQVVLDFLHNHEAMIDLNPLVIERHPLSLPPSHCPDEERQCVWWSMTDKISYMPGVRSDLTYTAAFQDLRDGIRTHCYAPMGTHIRERWSLGGTLPGEPKQPVELGIGAPSQGLYIREDVEVRCNFLMASFVKKTILKAHGVLVERLVSKAKSSGAMDTPMPLSPSSTTFHDAHSASSSGRSSSTHADLRNQYGTSSGTSTPQSRRYSPPSQLYHQFPHQHSQQQSSGGLQPFYGHHRAAASESGLVPEPLRTGRKPEKFGSQSQQQQQQQQQGGGNVHTGQEWEARPTRYAHDQQKPYVAHQAPQTPPLNEFGYGQPADQARWANTGHGYNQGAPIAELSGSETHIAELQ